MPTNAAANTNGTEHATTAPAQMPRLMKRLLAGLGQVLGAPIFNRRYRPYEIGAFRDVAPVRQH
jgi:hypothetical protein